jgi:peptidyl-prolyl cis-trans isomerase C
MKFLPFFVITVGLWAQAAPTPPIVTGTLPNLPDEEVVATLTDGTKVTMADVKAIFGALNPVQQQGIVRDPASFLHQWGVMRRLSQIAVERKLDQQAPLKQILEQNRMNLLWQAAINDTMNSIVIEPSEITKAYDENKSKYTEVKVKAIYIAYSDAPAPAAATPVKGKKLTEAEAKAKAEKLLAQIRGGADFVKLVKENSEDEDSRNKNGDFATLKASDNIPDAFRAAIFKLKPGETTEPLKQPNGYYLLRAEEVNVKPLKDVRDEIYNDLKNLRIRDWMDKMDKETKVEVNPKFAPPKKP